MELFYGEQYKKPAIVVQQDDLAHCKNGYSGSKQYLKNYKIK